MTYINQNIKLLRKAKGFTQEQLAEKVGVKRSVIGAYEEGRAEPNLDNVIRFSEVLQVSIEDLIRNDFSSQEKRPEYDVKGSNLRVLAISVDVTNTDKELIQLVPQKAAAGYLNGYSDPEYMSELPVINIPSLKNGTFRAFEIYGDSMLPIASGTIVIGKFLQDWESLKDESLYIIISKNEGIVFKRVCKVAGKNQITLISTNPVYKPYQISLDEVLEVWEAKGYYSTVFPDPVKRITEILEDSNE